MTNLRKGKIPRNTTCPYSGDCGTIKKTACNGQGCPVSDGKKIDSDFSCAAARLIDMIFNKEKK